VNIVPPDAKFPDKVNLDNLPEIEYQQPIPGIEPDEAATGEGEASEVPAEEAAEPHVEEAAEPAEEEPSPVEHVDADAEVEEPESEETPDEGPPDEDKAEGDEEE
jgi:hypothetical protein